MLFCPIHFKGKEQKKKNTDYCLGKIYKNANPNVSTSILSFYKILRLPFDSLRGACESICECSSVLKWLYCLVDARYRIDCLVRKIIEEKKNRFESTKIPITAATHWTKKEKKGKKKILLFGYMYYSLKLFIFVYVCACIVYLSVPDRICLHCVHVTCTFWR